MSRFCCAGVFVILGLSTCAHSIRADETLALNAPVVGNQTSLSAATSTAQDTLPSPGVGPRTGKSILIRPEMTSGAPSPSPNLPPTRHTSSFAISEPQARASVQWLAELAIRQAPRTYDGDKDWGDTKEIFSGIKFERKGLRLRPQRRTREVRHGRWVKYELTLPAPNPDKPQDPDGVTAKIHSVIDTSDRQTGVTNGDQTNTHWRIRSSVESPMQFTARIERWNRGVQWYSLSVEGKMRIQLDSTASIAFLADYAEVPPALVIDPRITEAKLLLKEFEVDRVSKIGGDAAEEWGEIMERAVRDVFLRKQNEKLAAKLNKSIDKHRDDLRLSMADWFLKW